MKQITYFVLLLFLIGYISTADTCDEEKSKDDCLSHKITEAEKSEGYEMCCYSKMGSKEDCDSYTKESADASKKLAKAAGATFKCNSNWLNLGFGFILLILFF